MKRNLYSLIANMNSTSFASLYNLQKRLVSSPQTRNNQAQRVGKRLQIVGLAAVLLGLTSPAQAGVIRPFASRFTRNDTGDIQIVGNTLLTCPTATAGCTNAQAGSGTTLNNNNFNMVRVDVDADSTTINSSSANFNLPAGATVLWAGLYWGGDTTAGTNGVAAPAPTQRNTVKFATPTAGYTNITATQVDTDTSSGSDYQGLADVTSLVQAGGSGSYTVANVQTGTGVDRQGGWSLVVVYRDITQPARNLTVFDGFAVVNTTTPSVSFTVSGFTTPPSGPVTVGIGAVAYEGDLGSTGDNLNFNGTNLTDARNPTGNFFNSSITRLGSHLTNKNPNYVNQLGFDIDVVALNNPSNTVLGNNATSANINLTTSSEFYQPGVITTAIDIFAPIVAGNVNKSVTDINGGTVLPGDILEYTVTVANTGQDGALNNVLTDPIPANTAYIPGSLQIATGANTGVKTDAGADDQAEYDSTNNRVVFRLGTGATSTAGGTLAPTNSTSLKFRVQVNGSTPNGTTVSNQATVAYRAQTLGTDFTAQSDGDSATSGIQPTNVIVTLPDMAIAKSHTGNFTQGQTGTYTITATNSGTGTTNGTVTVSDTLPTGLTPTAASGTGWGTSCSISGQTVTCTRSDALAAGSSYPPINVTVSVAPNAPASVTNTATVSGGAEINTGNNSVNDPTTINPAADLSLTKTHTGNFRVGQNGTYTLTVTNNGLSPAAGALTVTDTLPTGLTFVSGTGTRWTCSASGQTVTCTNPDGLASGASSTINLTVAVGVAAAPSVTNTANVTSPTSDPTPANNTTNDPTTVAGSADLSLTKTSSNPAPQLGDTITYTVTLNNSGPSTATNIQVLDQLPAGFTFGSGTSTLGTTYNSSTGIWSVPSLASVTLQITGTANSTGPITNTAEVTASDQFDPDSTPNNRNPSEDDQASVTTPLQLADLSISKTDGQTTTTSGSPITYTIVVTNNGPSNVTSATINDTVPSTIIGVSWTCVASTGSSCGAASGTGNIINTTANLLNGGTATYTVSGTVSPTATGSIQNTASVAVPSGLTDTINTNNSATDTTETIIQAPSQVRLVKRITAINSVNLTGLVDDPNDVNDNPSLNWPSGYLRGAIAQAAQPGDTVEYTIYFLSDGGSDATNVKVCDLMPANTTLLRTAFNGFSPTDGGSSADLGTALALGSTSPTAYLTNVADSPDRGQFFPAGTSAPAACSPPTFTTPLAASSNQRGAIVVDVATSPNTLLKATAPGTPNNSYGFIRFKVKVNQS